MICLQTAAFTPPAPITAPLFGAGDQQPQQHQHQHQQPSPVGRYFCVTSTVLSLIGVSLSIGRPVTGVTNNNHCLSTKCYYNGT